MPIPKPNKGESHKDFDDRCMSNDTMVEEYPDEKQRYAICQSQWEKVHGAKVAPDDVERRVVNMETAELRASDDAEPKLTGYAAKFGVQTDLGFFKERIRAGAFDEALKESDCRALKNHDPNLLLGRESAGTLRLSTNTVGLQFEVDLPDTTAGRDTREEVRRGDLQGCSFSFTVAEDEWKNRDDGSQERTITRIGKLFDVGPVTFPAYEQTTISARSAVMASISTVEIGDLKKDKPPAQEPEPSTEISPERKRELDKQWQAAQWRQVRNEEALKKLKQADA
jgi:HK97 family phage prohead protease